MKKKSSKFKILIMAFLLMLALIVLLVVVTILFHKDDNKILEESNNTVNEISNNEINNEISNDNEINIPNSNTNSNTTNGDTNEEVEKLTRDRSLDTYFWVRDRLSEYYTDSDNIDITNIIDKDVIKANGLNEENAKQYVGFKSAMFRIDAIYKQILDKKQELYVVKHVYGNNENDLKQAMVWIRKDNSTGCFSIYPYEYLQKYLNLKEGDVINLTPLKKIEENENNSYGEQEEITTEICMKELFEKYKFDLMLDREHLYNILDEEYRNMKFPKQEDLEKYINENKTELYLDKIDKFNVVNYDSYIEFKAICDSERNFVFKTIDMTDYTLLLDSYSILQNKVYYEAVMPSAKSKNCIDRIFKAINNNDYDFVYEKLNPVQKNNYYNDKKKFQEFLQKNFYKENNYELDEDYLILSDDVYQFDIKVTDATGEDVSYKRLVMTVTLQDDDDFVISISNKRK